MKKIVDQIESIAGAAAVSLTEGMIVRLAELAERAGDLVDAATSPEMMELIQQARQSAPALTGALRRLEQASRTGALDTLLDLAEVLQAARVSMSDAMIARLAETARSAAEAGDLLVTSGVMERAPALARSISGAWDEATSDSRYVGPLELLRALRRPETQLSLKFLLALARRLPETAR